jgi:hypothetical protein
MTQVLVGRVRWLCGGAQQNQRVQPICFFPPCQYCPTTVSARATKVGCAQQNQHMEAPGKEPADAGVPPSSACAICLCGQIPGGRVRGQFRTEKYQFRTEKCQFRTETCQFSNSGPEHCDSGTLLGIGPPSLYWYPSLDCKEGVTTYHPGTTHLSRPRTHSSRAVLAARETTNGY